MSRIAVHDLGRSVFNHRDGFKPVDLPSFFWLGLLMAFRSTYSKGHLQLFGRKKLTGIHLTLVACADPC